MRVSPFERQSMFTLHPNEPKYILEDLRAQYGEDEVTVDPQMKIGDLAYRYSDDLRDSPIVFFERKTPSDFISSITNRQRKSVFEQVSEMITTSRWSYLIITGMFRRTVNGCTELFQADNGQRSISGFAYNSVVGALKAISATSVQIVMGLDYPAAVELCLYRTTQALSGAMEAPAQRSILHYAPLPPAQQFFAALPGIGEVKAKKLNEWRLEHSLTIGDVITSIVVTQQYSHEIEKTVGAKCFAGVKDFLKERH